MLELDHVVRFLILTIVVAALALVSLAVGQASRPDSADAAGGPQAAALGPWPIFNFDPRRDGVNPNAQTISTSNVSQLRLVGSATLPSVADSTAVYANRQVYFTLKDGSLVALNVTNGAQLWRDTTSGPNYTTSSPALDVSGQWVYSYGLDGFVHKYAPSTGQESVGGGWPVKITNMPTVEKGSSSLNRTSSFVYMTTSGYPGDAGHYEGHVVAINLATGAATVFNTLCSSIHQLLTDQPGQPNYCPDVRSGVWARAGAVVDPTTGDVFIASGNGNFNGTTDWGDSVVDLSADVTTLLDSYTPTNYQQLQNLDLDLGSSAPAIFPVQSTSTTPYLAAQVGKDGQIRLLNRRNLNGTGHPGGVGGELQMITAPGTCEVLTAPVVWTDTSGKTWLIVANDCGLAGYNLVTDNTGKSTLARIWQQSQGGTSPVLANGVLYVVHNNGGAIDARDPTTGALLWTSSQVGVTLGGIHWESPIILNNLLLISDESGKVYAFAVKT